MKILLMWICLLYANGFMFGCALREKETKPIIQYHGFFFWMCAVILVILENF